MMVVVKDIQKMGIIALSFDGVDDYVTISDNEQLHVNWILLSLWLG